MTNQNPIGWMLDALTNPNRETLITPEIIRSWFSQTGHPHGLMGWILQNLQQIQEKVGETHFTIALPTSPRCQDPSMIEIDLSDPACPKADVYLQSFHLPDGRTTAVRISMDLGCMTVYADDLAQERWIRFRQPDGSDEWIKQWERKIVRVADNDKRLEFPAATKYDMFRQRVLMVKDQLSASALSQFERRCAPSYNGKRDRRAVDGLDLRMFYLTYMLTSIGVNRFAEPAMIVELFDARLEAILRWESLVLARRANVSVEEMDTLLAKVDFLFCTQSSIRLGEQDNLWADEEPGLYFTHTQLPDLVATEQRSLILMAHTPSGIHAPACNEMPQRCLVSRWLVEPFDMKAPRKSLGLYVAIDGRPLYGDMFGGMSENEIHSDSNARNFQPGDFEAMSAAVDSMLERSLNILHVSRRNQWQQHSELYSAMVETPHR